MTKPLLSRIGLALFTALVMFGLCELAARAVLPPSPGTTKQPQVVYLFDHEIGYVQAPNQKAWLNDGYVTTNSLGFRGGEIATPKPAGRFRTVVIGDSVTLGLGVGDNETYAAQLEQLLHQRFPGRDLDVVNLGVSGYDTRREVALLKRYVPLLQPDLVIVGFYTNDLPDALDDTAALASSGTTIAAKNPRDGQVLRMNDVPASWLNRQFRRSRIIYTVGRLITRLAGKGEWGTSHFSMEIDMLEGKESADLDRGWGIVKTELGDLRTMAAADGFSVGIVVLPCKEQVLGQYPNARFQTRLQAIGQPLGFFVVDPLPAFAASDTRKDALFIPYDRNHPSAAGHRIIGETIAHYLEEHELVMAKMGTVPAK